MPLSTRGLKVEPDRASALQRNQQELGGPPPRQLRDHAQLHPNNENRTRTGRRSRARQARLPNGTEVDGQRHEACEPPPTQDSTRLELHDPASRNVKLFSSER